MSWGFDYCYKELVESRCEVVRTNGEGRAGRSGMFTETMSRYAGAPWHLFGNWGSPQPREPPLLNIFMEKVLTEREKTIQINPRPVRDE
jgi:hypothetical protein